MSTSMTSWPRMISRMSIWKVNSHRRDDDDLPAFNKAWLPNPDQAFLPMNHKQNVRPTASYAIITSKFIYPSFVHVVVILAPLVSGLIKLSADAQSSFEDEGDVMDWIDWPEAQCEYLRQALFGCLDSVLGVAFGENRRRNNSYIYVHLKSIEMWMKSNNRVVIKATR
ncbi:uncharacterized protein MELLADRAFT_104400 [Melampsora larici-populina 98AG31]|uniref:Uncharacterized protein n=1 Tax=Melampsora larici-populina (strain 98AG31 / pathotype 3-4-7) TaxID=747676 RepID=F4REJ8_MELLP|nr:uncharacterized protein MELLADRAFT_104400 [Melampsora larici-populina 98AG31]EGG09108.1 hypothetical protein MELLADRAFT_104400 [Melampsora larici-populina 98AG31]